MNARVSLVPAENKRELREDVTDNNIDDPLATCKFGHVIFFFPFSDAKF